MTLRAGQDESQGPRGIWVHCSPGLLNSGVRCGATKRRPCECDPPGSHDHFLWENSEDYRKWVKT